MNINKMNTLQKIEHKIRSQFGGYSNLARHSGYMFAHRLGVFRKQHQVDWGRVDRLVFVCHGNICRSPYAEYRAQQLGARADSFGISPTSGAPANSIAIAVATRRGIELAPHRAKTQEDIDIVESDLILAMEPRQVRLLTAVSAFRVAQISLLGLFGNSVRPFIADPWGRTEEYFETCFTTIDTSIENIFNHLIDQQ